MKSKLLFSMMIALLLSIGNGVSQNRSDFDIQAFAGPEAGGSGNYIENASSTYWFGKTWLFYWEYDQQIFSSPTWNLRYGPLDIDKYGHTNDYQYFGKLATYVYQSTFFNVHISSCSIGEELFFCYYAEEEQQKQIQFGIKNPDGGPFKTNSVAFDYEVKEQMAVIGLNDTLYLFFVDDADQKVKYYRALVKYGHEYQEPTLDFIESSANVLSSTIKSAGNIAACHFSAFDTTNTNSKDIYRIMLALPAESSKNSKNEIFIFTGKQDQFQVFTSGYTVNDYPGKNVSIEQGSIKGGKEKSYMFQLGYSGEQNSYDVYNCEFDYNEKSFGDWHKMTSPDINSNSSFSGFASYYNKTAQRREKHLYLMFRAEYTQAIYAYHWESDKLIHFGGSDDRRQTPENHQASDYFDLIMVIEGAPPYALNGNLLKDVSNPSASSVTIGKSTTTEISVSTTYSQSVEASMGYGPVTLGFNASFQESSGSSQSETVSISETLGPPQIDGDSAGYMWYYCTVPQIERSQWRLCDYNENILEPSRSLFFFSITDLSPRWLSTSLSMYSKSPKPYDIHSYDENIRNVQGMSFLDLLGEYQGQVDTKGVLGTTIFVEWEKDKTSTFKESYDVSLSVDATVLDIFDVSTGITAGIEFERDLSTKVTKSIEINYNNPAPVWDETHPNFVHAYMTNNYVMKTVDQSAYFLDTEWKKKYRPYFITYEISDLNSPPSGIDDHGPMVEKYGFTNYPNPCGDMTHFMYRLSEKSNVRLDMYNQFGQLVSTIVNETKPAGAHSTQAQTTGLADGMYFYQLMIGSDVITGKLIVQ